MACTEGCVVALNAAGKMQYLLGRWQPEPENAEALVEFAAQHAASPSGVVANDQWPALVGLHFLGRIPPVDPAEGVDWRDDGCNL